MRSPYLALLLFATLLASCGQHNEPSTALAVAKQACAPLRPIAASTVAMATTLDSIEKNVISHSLEDQFVNGFRADHFGQLVSQVPDPGKRVELLFHQTDELVKAGRTREAIPIAEGLVQQMDQNKLNLSPDDRNGLLHLLGICYMRLGEQSNCVKGHTDESCIMPISKKGQHIDQEGSRKAIEVYKRILKEFPEDLTARWLINVASMTVGDYPAKVPAQWLIPEKAFGSKDALPHFTDVGATIGLDVNSLAGGVCMEDFNNDGFLDVMISGWSLENQLRLFQSNGDGSFTERTKEAGLTGLTGGLNMEHADYDNDGFMDVLVLRGAWLMVAEQPNSLLHNRGDGTFEDVTLAAGLGARNHTQAGCWGDYDNDGNLDLFIGMETQEKLPAPCALYHNNGNGTFTNVAKDAGVDAIGYFKGAVWGDVDNDGRLDLYASDLHGPNKLFMNQGPDKAGKVTFIDKAKAAGVTLPKSSFPAWMFDYDNDGWLDIYCGTYQQDQMRHFAANVCADYLGKPFPAEPSRLYHNNHNGTFTDATESAGLDRPLFAMGCNFGDIDNDGFPDFYLATGEPDLRSIIPNLMFRNDGHGHFIDVTTAGGFGSLQKGHAVAFGDLDNDGDQDIFVTMGGAFEGDGFHDLLFENPGMGNHWTTLFLQGTRSPRCAIGARIRITVDTPHGPRDIYSTVGTGGSFGSSSLRQEMGLGDATSIKQVEVVWPRDHKAQVFTNVPMDKPVRLVEGKDGFAPVDLPKVKLHAAPGAVPQEHHMM